MNKKILDEATIRLLKVLGEYTPDVEINDAITAMNIASVRIRRLENGWIPMVKNEEPEGKVWVAFDKPFSGEYTSECECAYFEDGIWRFWLTDKEISTHENGVTHWHPIPTWGEL